MAVLFVYYRPANDDYYPGVPNEHVTDEMWARFRVEQKRTIREARSQGQPVWVHRDQVDETEQERADREAAEQAARDAFERGNSLVRWRSLEPLVRVVGISPEQFGALGDGVADDTQAVQAALDAGAGGLVTLTGTYAFSRTLTIPAKTRVEGGGTLKLLPGYDLTTTFFRSNEPMFPYVLVEQDDVVIRDLTILGTTEDTRPQLQVGLLFINCTRGRAENLTIRYTNWDQPLAASVDATTSGMIGYGLGTVRASHITIRGGRFEFGGYENIGIADGSRHVLVDGVSCGTGWRTSLQIHKDVWEVDVVNTDVENINPNAHSAFTIHPYNAGDEQVRRVRISNTRIKAETDPERSWTGGLQVVEPVDGLSLTDVEIESNRWGIMLLARGASLTNVRVVSAARGLEFDGSDLTVQGGSYVSTLTSSPAIGLRLTSKDVRLRGVVMKNVASTGFDGGGENITIQGCMIEGKTYGARVQGSATKGVIVVDNIVKSVDNAAIYNSSIDGANGATLIIRGNTITAPTTAAGRAIWITSNVAGAIIQGNTVIRARIGVDVGSNASKAIIKDNNLLGVTVTGIANLAADSIVQDNLVPTP